MTEAPQTYPATEPALEALCDPRRLAALGRTGLLDSPAEESFDRLTRLAAGMVGTPISLVSLVSAERQFFKSAVGLDEPIASRRGTPLSYSFCKHTLGGDALVVTDAREHPLVRDNPAVPELGVTAYLGIPLTLRTGETLGSLCVIDTRPRVWSEADVAILRDLAAGAVTETELRLALADAAVMARTDALTGLPNHGALHETLREETARAGRPGGRLALIVLDIDHFKAINDAHGHLVGDAVLAEVAARIRAQARDGDTIARAGGEEFAWVLPDADEGAAAMAAERARHAVGATPIGDVGTVTISGGVASHQPGDDAHDLYRRADNALYVAKADGRNRVATVEAHTRDTTTPGTPPGVGAPTELAERRLALVGVRMIARVVDAKDPATRMHSERVAAMAVCLATDMGWSVERAALLHEAGLVHDVGKIGVPDATLLKVGRLSEEEMEQIRAHAALGAHIVDEVLSPEQTTWVRAHHERIDGTGYPHAIAGDAIPEGARILAVADSWDAMTVARHYSAPMSTEQALEECRRQSGRQFCPRVVAALERLLVSDRIDVGHLPAPTRRARGGGRGALVLGQTAA